jgi:hypothetical protein
LKIIPGVLGEHYMFPYLTIIHRSQDEREDEVVERAALIATCILSSHVKPIRSNGKYDELSAFLRHYVVIVTGDPGFAVFQAKPGASSYLFSRIGFGKLSYGSGNFQLWLHRIHEWAVEVWKPNMMAAFSPQYLQLKDEGPETNGEDTEGKGNPAVDEASRDMEMWAAQPSDQGV